MFLVAAPPPDAQVAAELTEQVQAADRLERDVTNEAVQEKNDQVTGETAAPITISLGQTTDQVIALLGNPKRIVNLGNKQIYIYADMKITFLGGRVSDVE
jgi:hypothetical protein